MGSDIKESDWKRFKELHPLAYGRYDQKSLEQVQYFLTDKTKSATERYFEIRDGLRERDQDRHDLFDDFRRSTALIQILAMRAENLITDEEMLRFSEELQDKIANMLRIRD